MFSILFPSFQRSAFYGAARATLRYSTRKPLVYAPLFGLSFRTSAAPLQAQSTDTVMEKVDTSARLKSLRDLMKEQNLDIYIVPSQDSHNSEYVAPCDLRREFISGFTGSAGTAVVTHEKAALATDGRYFNQAAKQLDENWTLLRQGMEDVPTWQEWTAEQAEGGKTVGVDATLLTASGAKRLAETIKRKGGGELVGSTTNLVDTVWAKDKPARPNEKVKVHPLKFSGKESSKKIEELRKELEKKKSAGLVISMLDEVAWLFNLRGSDIPYNPVFFSYAVVTPTTATLYIDDTKFEKDVREHLGDGVHVRPYSAIFDDVKVLGEELTASTESPKRKFWISTNASWALGLALGEKNVEEIRSPIADSKAIKNDVELEGMRQCHIRDGAALTEYFSWLEHELVEKKSSLDEVQAADKLEQIRSRGEHFVGLSFDTISSTGPNAAVIHYSPERGNCATVDPKAIYLCDSGAQYLDGTTDTTRTLHFGEPSDMEKKSYTLVLKGVIALDQATFPKGTNGLELDILARHALWKEGLDYRHGTGHGVGSYLNVHEGPIGVGTRVQYTEVALSPGNVISDEPGYYEDGSFGIRIENMILCKPKETTHKFGDKPWLGFEYVTMTPMCQRLIDTSILTEPEIKWVNEYHQAVWEKTKGFFEGSEDPDKKRALQWLVRETAKIGGK